MTLFAPPNRANTTRTKGANGLKCGKAQLATNRPLRQRKNNGRLEKSPCKSVEHKDNREINS
jgi:hypothetical protein